MNLSTSPRFTSRHAVRRSAPLGVLALFAAMCAGAGAEPAGSVPLATGTVAAAAAAVVVSAPLAPSARLGEHPAVLQWRRAQSPAPLDPNRFIVQPPATARWTDASDDTPAPVYARR